MAFSTLLRIVLENNTADTYLANTKETLKVIAAVLDCISCIALAALAIAGSMGAIGTISPGMIGILAGASFSIGCMTLKSIINLAINNISRKNFWLRAKTEKYLMVPNLILNTMTAIAIFIIFVHSIKIISRAGCIPSFYSGFGTSSGAILFGSALISITIKLLISSICNKSKNDLKSSTIKK